MALSESEIDLINKHRSRLAKRALQDEKMLRYYKGRQRVEQLGMAIPPEMRKFLVIANWVRTVVDTINSRQQVRELVVPDDPESTTKLRAIWDGSNMAQQIRMFNADRMIYGRAFISAGTNESDARLPLIRVESPRQMDAIIDTRREVVESACRFYTNAARIPDNARARVNAMRFATLYLPNVTVYVQRDKSGEWVEIDRDEHEFGEVPVVMHLNRRMTGDWDGESQVTDIIPLVDAGARSLTNMQFAQEAHGIPRMWMTAVHQDEFKDAKGNLVPQFEAYFDAIHTLRDKDAKVGQLDAADLKNFETAMTIYGKQASTVTGFPARYFGMTTVNPPAEGAVYADESPMNRSIEMQNEEVGVTLSWVAAIAIRMAGGAKISGNLIAAIWQNPGTPTVSQREDALSKRRAAGVLSREGYWDELGWSQTRKDQERAYLDAEMSDPYLDAKFESRGASVAADSSE